MSGDLDVAASHEHEVVGERRTPRRRSRKVLVIALVLIVAGAYLLIRLAEATTEQADTPRVPNLNLFTVPPVSPQRGLAALVPRLVPGRLLRVQVGGVTGPFSIDDVTETAAERRQLIADGFLGGFAAAWRSSDRQRSDIVFISEFSSAKGARDYSAASWARSTSPGEIRFHAPEIPGSAGVYREHVPSAAILRFAKGRYEVQVVAGSLNTSADLRSTATDLGRIEYALIP